MKNNIDLINEFIIYLQIKGYSKSSAYMYPAGVAELLEESKKEAVEITLEDIKSHQIHLENRPNKRRKGGLSSRMIRHYLSGIKLFYDWLEKLGIIMINPMSSYGMPEVEKQERETLNRKEIVKLYEFCKTKKERAVLGIFYGCGLRRSEGERLNMKDIDFVNSVIYVRKGKGNKSRTVPMSEGVRRDFRNYYLEERPIKKTEKEAFIINEIGKRMRGNSYNKILKKLLKKAKINKEMSLHHLRHSIATHLLDGGLEIERIRDFLGHESLEATQIYTHISKAKGIIYGLEKLPEQ